MSPATGHGRAWRALLAVALAVAAVPTVAARDEWLKLEAPQFGVVSQLDEQATRRWAGEFGQFVEALHRLYAIDDRKLSPLTIVLFRRARDFAPYRPHTESGQASKVEGLFGRQVGWSIIGTMGGRPAGTTRRVIQHEAVHWFFSADPVAQPLWFAEGFAEVFSTFEVKDGKGRWGDAIPEHVAYLSQRGLMPLEDFFQVRQDEALHDNARFYPQAWAFVHYGLFGDGGVRQAALGEFASRAGTESNRTAFEAAFGKGYEAVDRDLRRYLDRGSYAMAVVDLPDRAGEFVVTPASPLQVRFALGRLAAVGGNAALALEHADAVRDAAPQRPEGYELRALALFDSGDRDGAGQAIAEAVRLGSQDAGVLLLDAELQLARQLRDDTWPDQVLVPEVARQIADSAIRSLAVQLRNPRAFEVLMIALLNVAQLSEQDERLLEVSRRLLPDSGLPDLVRAAAANRRGDLPAAQALLAQARSADRELPVGLRPALPRLGERWLMEALAARGAAIGSLADLDVYEAQVREALTLPDGSAALQKALEVMQLEASVYRAHLEGVAAAEAGDLEAARSHWQSIVDDPDAPRTMRRNAERAIRSLDP